MLFAGRIIDRLGTKWGYAIALIIWSLGAVMHAYSEAVGEAFLPFAKLIGFGSASISVVGFMLSRAVLGFGESGNFPAAIKATAEYFPKKERSFATGIFNSGSNVGAILAPISVPLIASEWGWEAAFWFIGGFGFIWLIFWFMFYEIPSRQKRLSKAENDYIHSDVEEVLEADSTTAAVRVPWFKLLGYKQTWSFAFGKFMTDGVWWFFLFWLPAYLKAQYGMQGTAVILPLAVLYSMTMFGSIGGGYFPTYFINKGYKPYDGRMRAMFIIALIPLLVLAAQPLGHISFWFPVILIGIGASAHQAWSANIFTTVSDMFPKKTVASVTGIGGMAGGFGGVFMTKLGGFIFDKYTALGQIETGYTIMFAICAVAYIIAWSVMKLLVPKMKAVEI
jgi:ACS family hexuronate transporter-like MFS transporter